MIQPNYYNFVLSKLVCKFILSTIKENKKVCYYFSIFNMRKGGVVINNLNFLAAFTSK